MWVFLFHSIGEWLSVPLKREGCPVKVMIMPWDCLCVSLSKQLFDYCQNWKMHTYANTLEGALRRTSQQRGTVSAKDQEITARQIEPTAVITKALSAFML